MKPIITVGIALICALFGTAAALPFAGDSPPIGALFFGSFIVGLYIGNSVATALAYKPKRRQPKTKASQSPRSRTFSDRLHDYLQVSQSCQNAPVQESEKSRMSFWMIGITHKPALPKSSSFIRRILFRIRSILNNNGG